MLDVALREHGISDPAARRQVCESFVFRLGEFHDQCWFMAEGRPHFPLLCFSTRFLNLDTPVEELGTVHAPSAMFSFHEYATGSVAAFYEGDPAARVETGPVGRLDDA